MAQINFTIDQDEVLKVLGNSTGEAFRMILQESLNSILQAESAEQLRAGRLAAPSSNLARKQGRPRWAVAACSFPD
ncbi:MAG: hypothetical protein Q4E12_04175 [Coriobacteriia bacterium]|nr:hypothetical protein [Coriobacteriia bacterium]